MAGYFYALFALLVGYVSGSIEGCEGRCIACKIKRIWKAGLNG